MGVRKTAAKKTAAKSAATVAASTGAQLLVNNVTREHTVAIPVAQGQVALFPVTLRTPEHVADNFSVVEE